MLVRAAKVRADITRSSGPLDKDFAEQVVQMENDAVLAGIGEATAAELAQINRALAQLDAGSYGTCSHCGKPIDDAPAAGAAVFRPLHHLRRSRGLTAPPAACPPTRFRCANSATSCTKCWARTAHYRALGRDDINAELIEGVLEGAARFAEDVVAPTNEAGDRIGVRRTDDGRVVTPPGFAEAYRQYVDDGWAALCGPAEAGGQGLPESIGGVVGEMLVSANMSWKLYSGLTDSAVLCLDQRGTEEMRRIYLPKLVSGVWSGTMVLTEPHAGTDLGLMRTRAEPQADGSYRITGTKIFITSGEHDLTENIVHLVLAKLPDAPAGSRGISMFLVPKFLPDAEGKPGAANGVSCASVEHKLGIHGSATCVMNFDDSRGWLIGEVNGGLKNMFTMMNHARLWVGLQGLAQCERAFQASLAYARERRQGRTSEGGKGPADPIIGHPDVRRMLLTQKSLIEGARMLTYFAGMQMDRALHHPDAARASGSRGAAVAPDAGREGLRHRHVARVHERRAADPRRARLRARNRRRAVLPRCAHHADLRRRERRAGAWTCSAARCWARAARSRASSAA